MTVFHSFFAINVPQLTTIDISVQDVLAAVKNLKANLSAGQDMLPPLFFKHVRNAVAFPLAIIFEQLLSVAFVPEIWKTAVITPVHKKDLPIHCQITGLFLLLVVTPSLHNASFSLLKPYMQ